MQAMEIKALKLSSGSIKLIQHTDGTLNIQNALTTTRPIADTNEEFHLDIQVIRLDGIDIWKLNEENNVLVEAFIDKAESQFKTATNHILFSLDTQFQLNVIINGDSTFVKNRDGLVNWIDENHPELNGFIHDQTENGGLKYLKAIELYRNKK